jgi:hypothetical protein
MANLFQDAPAHSGEVKGGLVVAVSDNMTFDAGYENRIFPITLIVTLLVLILVGGFAYWYYASQKPEFEAVYAQLGIQPLPSTVERQQRVQARLSQLSREPCYSDAVVDLARALLENGYPRESATSLRSFAKRCGGSRKYCLLLTRG